ncbi:glycosyltransferase family 1 protein [Roseburia inulinivorans]|jgi:glycosyltransferase involved in cell wall biosynthesis|uniref:Glycosyltransferase family 1 protein n=1 Tax=Roseburia inulinivorans TaxID=360807 RepID=A0A0M6WF38_9FIRM|nr:glycosyltransferase family 1 protein [Roseburia inulinivorans]MBT9647655.1 glycosyltransferase [Roseburia inulinivorans]RGR67717.1 glycosyltransferase family 1 protein [Roseburia inulinivorans]CCY29742.1 glycosyltransferase group 1 family protein [Roseburia inulinivorans CAG:15]CRL34973.1 hypothetical protein RIL183_15711 [Roseburia inulinivorans]
MIRILQVVNIMDRAGLETMLMNYYRNIDRTKVQFDFLTHRIEKGAYEDEIISMGGKVYHAPRLYPQNYKKYFGFMKAFFMEHPEYKIIHSHIDAMSYFPLQAAKNSGVPVRIAHSHSSKFDRDIKLPIKFIAQKNITKVATINCACGEVAGRFMFHERPFKIVRNAVDIEKFKYDSIIGERKRKELGIENKFIIGHVGRYCYIKNQMFLIDVFNCVIKFKPNAHLLLVGKGENQKKIEEKIEKLGLKNKVTLLIDRSDVAELYQAMDIFVMPSLFEGLPVVGIEAQASGMPCLVSNRISKELLITSNIKMINLDKNKEEWAKEIMNTSITRNGNARQELIDAGYDIVSEAEKLQRWYLNLYDTVSKEN